MTIKIERMQAYVILFMCLFFISCEKDTTSGQEPIPVSEEIVYEEVPVPPTTPEVDESDYTIYYVNSEMGDDNNSGLSENAPIKTLSKAAVIARKPNTKVLFKRGQDGNGFGSFFTASSGVKNVDFYNNLIISTDRRSDFKMVATVNWLDVGKNENFTLKNNIFVATVPVNATFDLSEVENWKFENNLYYQVGSQSTLGDDQLLDYNPLVNIPDEFDGYENGLKFKSQEPKIFTDGLLIPGMCNEDMEGNVAEGIKYLGPFSK